jgi:hypothetical protein
MEKDVLKKLNVISSLKEWREQRDESYSIIRDMERKLKKEIFDYKESRNDPELPEIPKGPILEAWQSFSILEMSINYFGFGSEENWLNEVDNLSVKYYEDFLQEHQQLEEGKVLINEHGIPLEYHRWDSSVQREMKYRNWFKESCNTVDETIGNIENIDRGM